MAASRYSWAERGYVNLSVGESDQLRQLLIVLKLLFRFFHQLKHLIIWRLVIGGELKSNRPIVLKGRPSRNMFSDEYPLKVRNQVTVDIDRVHW